MKLIWKSPKPKEVTNAAGQRRFQVSWRLDAGRHDKNRKRSDFTHRADAAEFLRVLVKADHRVDGWTFDHDGTPVQVSMLADSVLATVTAYVDARWSVDWQDAQRTKARGRLQELIIMTVAAPKDRAALFTAFAHQRTDRGARPEPRTTVEWAARWLRDHALLPHRPVTDQRVSAGRDWLERESLPVTELTPQMLATLRTHFVGNRDRSTGRTYWQGCIVPYVNWLVNTDVLPKSPLSGMPTLARDLGREQPDPREIPDPHEVDRLAEWFGQRHGERWALWLLLVAYCALRKAESWAITGTSFVRRDDGRWLLEVEDQERRMVRSSSDDGTTTRTRKRTKSTRDRTGRLRTIPIPVFVATRLEQHFGDRLGTDVRPLFIGKRGAVAPTSVDSWFRDAVRDLFGEDPHLCRTTIHTLRHAGMTYWFAAGIDHKRAQFWGGWHSLKQMLDTYREVIRSLEAEQLEDLDNFHARWQSRFSSDGHGPDSATSIPPSGSTRDSSATVIDLSQFRHHRKDRTVGQ